MFDGYETGSNLLCACKRSRRFVPLLGFDDIGTTYASQTPSFPFFAQRLWTLDAPTRNVILRGLALTMTTRHRTLARSLRTVPRKGDTIQLFPVPQLRSEGWHCYFLVNGVRHLMSKTVPVHGVSARNVSLEELEALLVSLEPATRSLSTLDQRTPVLQSWHCFSAGGL